MKWFYLIVSFLILSFLITCKSEKKVGQEMVEEQTNAVAESEAFFTPPDMADIQFDQLSELQQQIMRSSADAEIRKKFISQAYFADHNSIITIGIARLTNPETGAPITRGLVQRAAQVDANRWAAYGISWIKNSYQPDFGKLQTFFQGEQKVLMSYTQGDSLYLAVASRVN
ncbi:MAG: hypothetical protein AB7T22_05945 [Calditrichaceae bacterium]